jgi:hypothetical protein
MRGEALGFSTTRNWFAMQDLLAPELRDTAHLLTPSMEGGRQDQHLKLKTPDHTNVAYSEQSNTQMHPHMLRCLSVGLSGPS